MSTGRRWLIIAGLLAATLAAAVWVGNAADGTDLEIAEAAVPGKARARPSPSGTRSATPQIDVGQLATRDPGKMVRDPFSVPALKPRKDGRAGAAAPKPPPKAPPMPFAYMGKLLSGQDTAVFLTQGDRNLVLREGDTIDSVYRVERIAEQAITLIYLPLDERQTISIGDPP